MDELKGNKRRLVLSRNQSNSNLNEPYFDQVPIHHIEGILKNQSKADQSNISEKDTGQQKINHGAKTQLNPIQSLNLQGDSANNFQEPQTPRSTFVDVSAQQQIKALQSQVSQLIQCLTEQQAQKN